MAANWSSSPPTIPSPKSWWRVGELTEDEAAVHPHRHILTRALGVQSDVAVDVWQIVPEEGDRFLLCSDGLTNEVPAEGITEVLTDTRDPQEVAEALVRMANQAGGNDNATVVVLDVMVGESPSAETAGTLGVEEAAASPPRAPGGPDGSAVASAASGATMVESPPESPPAPVEPSPAGTVTANGVGAAVVSRSAPDVDLGRAPARQDQRTGPRIPCRITFRVILFLVVLGGLAYAGFATIRWYVNSSYFVGLSHNHVVIFQGRPGGFVGINPKIVHRTQVTVGQVPSYKIPDLRGGVQEPSYKDALGYVTSLQQSVCSLDQPPAYCPTATTPAVPGSTPATTVPGSTPATTVLGATPTTFGLEAPILRSVYGHEAA